MKTFLFFGGYLALDVSVVPFKHIYFSMLTELLSSQNYPQIDAITMKNLPKIGFIAILGAHPIAIGFLRRVEPCYGQIDTLASNANFGSKIRHEGVKLVVDSLLDEAKRLKLHGVIAFTRDSSILKRASDLDFYVVPQTIITKQFEY